MNTKIKVALSLLLACGVMVPACGQEEEHDHDHDHRKPAATTNAAASRAGHDDHTDHDDEGHADEVKLTAEAIKLAGIRVEPVRKHALAATLTAPARVVFNAEAMAHVGSALPGRVVELKARVGDVVDKGDELLVVESAELGAAQSDYLQKRTDAAVALAAVEPAKQAFERAKKLYDESQGIALGEVQKRQAELKAAEGAALTAKSAAGNAYHRLLLLGMTKDQAATLEENGMLNAKLPVRAPIAGSVIEREVTLGELVTPEQERLLVLADTKTVWVLADVPESRLAQVTVGSPARIQIAAVPDRQFDGKIAHVAPALNPDTRAGRVRVEVANPNGVLRPGMFASVTLTAAASPLGGEATLAVPDEAVQTVEGAPTVFVPVEGEPNTFAKRAVTVGRSVGGMVPILSGVREGEPVVVVGTFILKAELGKSEAGHEH